MDTNGSSGFNSGSDNSRDGSGMSGSGGLGGASSTGFGNAAGSNNAGASDQQYSSSDGSVRISSVDGSNQLLVRARPSQWEEIKDAILKLDNVPLQVQIETRILEVSLTGEFRFGVQWYLQGLTGSTTDSDGNVVPGQPTGTGRWRWARAATRSAASRCSTRSSTATCRWPCVPWRPAATPRRCRRPRWW